ncbi:unnamed protein product [Prunus armeniaca]
MPCHIQGNQGYLSLVMAFSCMGKYGVALNTELLGTPSHKQRQCEACHAQASRHGHGRLVVPCHIQDLPKMKRRGLSNKHNKLHIIRWGVVAHSGGDQNSAATRHLHGWGGENEGEILKECTTSRGCCVVYVKGGCLADRENCSPDFFDRVAWCFEVYRRSSVAAAGPKDIMVYKVGQIFNSCYCCLDQSSKKILKSRKVNSGRRYWTCLKEHKKRFLRRRAKVMQWRRRK